MDAPRNIAAFKGKLLVWYAANKRSLPFRGEKDPYKIWVSEVLLQQTQMSRGVEYYKKFIKRFPTVRSLAKASWQEFLPYFRGLGFYNRGRNMLKAARFVVEEYKGVFPDDFEKLIRIPGVGPYTANAILSFAYDHPVLTVDTNVGRILDRVFGWRSAIPPSPRLRWAGSDPSFAWASAGRQRSVGTSHYQVDLTTLTKKVERLLGAGESADLNQAMMDLGSAVCLAKRPKCGECPLRDICMYGKRLTAGSDQLQAISDKRLAVRGRKVEMKSKKEEDGSKASDPSHPQLPITNRRLIKHPIALIHQEGKVLLHRGKLLSGDVPRGDERAFLKGLAEQYLGLEISVRPPFLVWVKGGVRYSAHRCYILSGVIPRGATFLSAKSLLSAQDVRRYV